MTDNTGGWGTLERWRSVALLGPGVGFLLITVNAGFIMVANTGMDLPPLVHLGLMLVAYVGLLGLSRRIVEHAPRLGRVCQALPLIFGLEIVLAFGVGLLPATPPRALFALTVALGVVGGILTMTAFGVASLWTRAYPRPVGGFLLLTALGFCFVIVKSVLFGDLGGPEWVTVVNNGLVGLSLTAVGYVLRTEGKPADGTESAEAVG